MSNSYNQKFKMLQVLIPPGASLDVHISDLPDDPGGASSGQNWKSQTNPTDEETDAGSVI